MFVLTVELKAMPRPRPAGKRATWPPIDQHRSLLLLQLKLSYFLIPLSSPLEMGGLLLLLLLLLLQKQLLLLVLLMRLQMSGRSAEHIIEARCAVILDTSDILGLTPTCQVWEDWIIGLSRKALTIPDGLLLLLYCSTPVLFPSLRNRHVFLFHPLIT